MLDAGLAVVILVGIFVGVVAVAGIAHWQGYAALADKALEWSGIAFMAVLVMLKPSKEDPPRERDDRDDYRGPG